jgi:hypothetical protein
MVNGNPVRFAIFSLIQRALLPCPTMLAPHHNAREPATSLPLFENSSARTDRVRTAERQVCEKWTLAHVCSCSKSKHVTNGVAK